MLPNSKPSLSGSQCNSAHIYTEANSIKFNRIYCSINVLSSLLNFQLPWPLTVNNIDNLKPKKRKKLIDWQIQGPLNKSITLLVCSLF